MGQTVLEEMIVAYKADLSNLSSGIQKAKEQIQSVPKAAEEASGGLKNIGKSALSMAGGFAAFSLASTGIGMLKDQIVDTVKSALDQQQIMADTVQTLKTMGSASGQTAESIGNFADSMTQVTKFSDDMIQHGENVMLTFGNIGKSIFPQATLAAMNMSQKLGTDLQSSIIQVGKALNDPIQGVGALQRVGVSFTDSEKKQIQTMMDHKNIAGAQAVVMSELKKQFGGVAEAAGKTTAGALQIAENRFGLLKEKIGTAVLPAISQLASFISTTAIPAISKIGDAIGGVIDWFGKHDAALTAVKVVMIGVAGALVVAFGAWAIAAAGAAIATIAATWPILAVGAGVALVVGGIILVVQHWGAIMGWINGVVHTVGGAIGGFFSGLGSKVHGIITGIGGAFSGLGSTVHGVWSGIVGSIKWAINIVIDLINGFIRGVDSIGIDLGPVHIHPNIPTIPHFATGGLTWGGSILVGERGPEILSPPAGSMVSPLTGGASSFSGGRVVNVHLHVEMDKREMAYALLNDISQLQAQHVRLKTGLKR